MNLAADHQTVTVTFFWCKFGFGKCLGTSFPCDHWAGCHWWLCKIHFLLHVKIWSRNISLLLCRIRKGSTSKWWYFLFLVSSWGSHVSNFFTFPVCFQCQTTIEWSWLSFWATSHAVVRGSPSMMLCYSLSTSDGRPLRSSSSRLLSPLQNFLNHYWTVHSLAVPGPSVLLILLVVSAALWRILNSNKKITQICFLSNINSLAKDINRWIHLKMMCNVTTFI